MDRRRSPQPRRGHRDHSTRKGMPTLDDTPCHAAEACESRREACESHEVRMPEADVRYGSAARSLTPNPKHLAAPHCSVPCTSHAAELQRLGLRTRAAETERWLKLLAAAESLVVQLPPSTMELAAVEECSALSNRDPSQSYSIDPDPLVRYGVPFTVGVAAWYRWDPRG